MQAEIIAIGTELLLGNTLDTNTHFLANLMRQLGVDLFRTSTIGDNAGRIAEAVQESLARAEVVITSGGLGPTIDDATREGLARALNRPLKFIPDLWDQIQDRFKRFGRRPTENNRRQAFIPCGAHPVENPVGTAPAFYVEIDDKIVVALPGVPGELTTLAHQALVPLLQARMDKRNVILTRHIRTAGIGESWLDQIIQDLEQGQNPTVGLSAQPGRVDIRITAKAEQEILAAKMLDSVESELEQRLGNHIYGTGEDTLEMAVVALLKKQETELQLWASGFEGQPRRLVSQMESLSGVSVHIEQSSDLADFKPAMERAVSGRKNLMGLGLTIQFSPDSSRFEIGLLHQDQWIHKKRSFGGAPEYAHQYALSHALDTLRRYLLDN